MVGLLIHFRCWYSLLLLGFVGCMQMAGGLVPVMRIVAGATVADGIVKRCAKISWAVSSKIRPSGCFKPGAFVFSAVGRQFRPSAMGVVVDARRCAYKYGFAGGNATWQWGGIGQAAAPGTNEIVQKNGAA
jgi:hypothetical protein